MEQPRSITVFGILNIVFGSFGLLGVLTSMVRANQLSANPAVAAMYAVPQFALWNKIYLPIGFAMGVLVLISGIGLLKLKPWARTTSMVYAIAVIVSALLNGVVFWIYIRPALLEKAATMSGVEAIGLKAGAYVGGVGSILGLVYPSLLLYFMNQPRVRAALAGQPPGLASN